MLNPLGTKEFGLPGDNVRADSVIAVRRHVERQKPSQKPTPFGELVAYAMGAEDRRNGFAYTDCTSSPKDRAVFTAVAYLRGVTSLEQIVPTKVDTDQRLDDFSTDSRPEVMAGLEAAKEYAITNGIEVEEALFMCREANLSLMIKANEFLSVLQEIGLKKGRHLITCHGSAINSTWITLIRSLDQSQPYALGAHGGLFDKVEGFDAYYQNGKLVRLEVIRLPKYLRVLEAAMK